MAYHLPFTSSAPLPQFELEMATPELQLDEHLTKALAFVNSQAVQMRRILESPKGQLLLAIKKASSMLGELRTARLPPRLYYELYNSCFDALSQLQAYLLEAHEQHHLADVYEIVQYTGSVLPRLYLMITVGTAFMETDDAPIQEVLKDMLEMAKGVQHPLRGLFLRYYLGQRTGPFITQPNINSTDLSFNVRFTLTNFIEMNKLWVRCQHQGHSRDLQKRTEERIQLETIVGSSILRLSQIDAIGVSMFKDEILPSILEQIIQCRDKLAQEYLLDIIVQVFPAEFHLDTLETYLKSLEYVHKNTSVSTILENSMNRIIGYVIEKRERENEIKSRHNTKNVEETMKEVEDLEKQNKESENDEAAEHTTPNDKVEDDESKEESSEEKKTDSKEASNENGQDDSDKKDVNSEESAKDESGDKPEDSETSENKKQPDSPPTESLDKTTISENSLLDVANIYWDAIHKLNINPDQRALIARKFIELFEALDTDIPLPELFKFVTSGGVSRSPEVEKLILSLFDSNQPLSLILDTLSSVTELLATQSNESIRTVTDKIINKFLATDGSGFGSKEQAQQVLGLFAIILRSGKVSPVNVSRLIHLLLHTDSVSDGIDLLQQAYKSIREHSQLTGIVLYAAIELLHRSNPSEVAKILKFTTKTCHDMAAVNNEPLNAFKMCVQCSLAADAVGAEEATYELFAQALTVYEEYITDSSQQVIALSIIIQALQQSTVFISENYDPLAQRCIQYGQRLFKKPDQCRTLLKAAHLYWDNNYSDSRGVEETLARALRSADSVMDTALSVDLFLDVLDTHLYFLSNETATVTVGSVNNVLKLIKDNLQNIETEDPNETKRLKSRLERIKQFVKSQQDDFPNFEGLHF